MPVVGSRHFTGVHHQHQCTDGRDLGVFDFEIDRHCLFEFGIGPTACAVGVGTTKHDQSAAGFAGIAHQHADLIVRKAAHVVRVGPRAARDIGQHDAIVTLQLSKRIEKPIAGRDGYGDFFAA